MYDFVEMQEELCRSYLTLSPEISLLMNFGTPTVRTPKSESGWTVLLISAMSHLRLLLRIDYSMLYTGQ